MKSRNTKAGTFATSRSLVVLLAIGVWCGAGAMHAAAGPGSRAAANGGRAAQKVHPRALDY